MCYEGNKTFWYKCHMSYKFLSSLSSCTGCPTRYRTRHFFSNFTTNEDIAGGPLLRVTTIRRTTDTFLFISHTTNVLLFKFRCSIFMPSSVASGTPCISDAHWNLALKSQAPLSTGVLMLQLRFCDSDVPYHTSIWILFEACHFPGCWSCVAGIYKLKKSILFDKKKVFGDIKISNFLVFVKYSVKCDRSRSPAQVSFQIQITRKSREHFDVEVLLARGIHSTL